MVPEIVTDSGGPTGRTDLAKAVGLVRRPPLRSPEWAASSITFKRGANGTGLSSLLWFVDCSSCFRHRRGFDRKNEGRNNSRPVD